MSTLNSTSTSRPPRTGRIPSLTGLRWFAALGVFAFHAVSMPYMFPNMASPISQEAASYAFAASEMGVSFFFILSGFVLTWSARPSDSPIRFWRRRFFKIYPAHLVACIAAIVIMVWTGITVELHHVPETLLLVQTWTTDVYATTGVNAVTWSLAAEAVFYLCFPVIFLLVTKIRESQLLRWAGVMIALVFIVPLLAKLLPDTPPVMWSPELSSPQLWFVRYFPITRMLEFVIGIIVARAVLAGKMPRIRLSAAFATVVVGYVLSTLLQTTLYGLVAMAVIPLTLLVVAAAQTDLDGRRWFGGSKTLVYLGNLSFAFYLVHRIVLEYLSLVFPSDFTWTLPWAIVLIAMALVVSIGVAAALHHGVEKPLYRRFAEPRRRAPERPPEKTPVTA